MKLKEELSEYLKKSNNNTSNILNLKKSDINSLSVTKSNLFNNNKEINSFQNFNKSNNKIFSSVLTSSIIETHDKFYSYKNEKKFKNIKLNIKENKYKEKSLNNIFKLSKLENKKNYRKNKQRNQTIVDFNLYKKPSLLRKIFTKIIKILVILILISSIFYNYIK